MSEVLQVLAVVAIVAYVIGRQLKGEPLRGKRVVLLPAILAVIGVVDLTRTGRHIQLADVVPAPLVICRRVSWLARQLLAGH